MLQKQNDTTGRILILRNDEDARFYLFLWTLVHPSVQMPQITTRVYPYHVNGLGAWEIDLSSSRQRSIEERKRLQLSTIVTTLTDWLGVSKPMRTAHDSWRLTDSLSRVYLITYLFYATSSCESISLFLGHFYLQQSTSCDLQRPQHTTKSSCRANRVLRKLTESLSDPCGPYSLPPSQIGGESGQITEGKIFGETIKAAWRLWEAELTQWRHQ